MDLDLHRFDAVLRKRRSLWRRIGFNVLFAGFVLLLMFHFAYPILGPAFHEAYYASR